MLLLLLLLLLLAQVSYYMDRRTKEQCYQRYVYSLKDSIRRGPFVDSEDMILIIGKVRVGGLDVIMMTYIPGALWQRLVQDIGDVASQDPGAATLSLEQLPQVGSAASLVPTCPAPTTSPAPSASLLPDASSGPGRVTRTTVFWSWSGSTGSRTGWL